MKVSIVIPVYNCEKYLSKCVESLQCQTYGDLELILVNDGSTDGSSALCRKYASEDSRVRVIDKPVSEGAGPARNSGIDDANGELIMFIDSDDWVEENMVEKLVEALQSGEYDVAVCGYETFVEGVGDVNNDIIKYEEREFHDAGETRGFFVEYFPEGIAGYLWNKIYRVDIIRENGIRFPDMRRLQDGVFNVRYFNCIRSCKIISEVLYHYRINAQIDMFRKCPRNYFDLIRSFSEYYIDIKKTWGEYSDEKIAVFFLNELGTCIENAYSPQWNMTGGERKEYFNTLAGDGMLNFSCEYLQYIGKYRRFLIKLLQSHSYLLIAIVIKVKVIFKMGFKRAFYSLRRANKNA